MKRLSDRHSVVVAVGLWLMFAFVVWNVIFDRIIVLAGRRYSYDAYLLYRSTGKYLLIDSEMRPAVTHAFTVASVVAVVIVAGSMLLIRAAALRDAARQSHQRS